MILRCPGSKNDEGTRHTSWHKCPRNPPEKRYRCQQCEAHYPHLVNVKTGAKVKT